MKHQSFLERLLEHMGIENAKVSFSETEEGIQVQIDVEESDSGLMIGYRGEIVHAVQKILQLMIVSGGEDKRIYVNVNDYKQRRIEYLQEQAEEAAARVEETGKSYWFGFLPGSERLIIHQFISQHPTYQNTLETVSSGEGRQRRLELRKKAA